jgi:two-component system, response regulator
MNTNVDILLVEDSKEDMELTLYALRLGNFANNIFVVHDGDEALDFLFCRGAFAERSLAHPPKLVLLDLKLPKMGGLEVLKELKSDPQTKTIPVVIMTSSRQERDLCEAYGCAVNGYVQKPVDFEEFRTTVTTLGAYWLAVNQPPVNQRVQLAMKAKA